MSISKLRIELFFNSNDQLRERIRLLRSKGLKSFNLVNKRNGEPVKDWVDIIKDEIPDSSVCAHFSAKYNKSHNCGKLSDFINSLSSYTDTEVLLVSGTGEATKNTIDSLGLLQQLQQQNRNYFFPSTDVKQKRAVEDNNSRIAVAFNPFFPLEKDRETERRRLVQKLNTGKVDKLYFQFGTDLNALESSLEWLTQMKRGREKKSPFELCGSIFLPTAQLIAQQKFRPWNGVFLSEEFLGSSEGAHGIVVDMIRLYNRYNVEILIEAPGVRNEKDISFLQNLLIHVEKKKKSFLSENNNPQPSGVTGTNDSVACNRGDEKDGSLSGNRDQGEQGLNVVAPPSSTTTMGGMISTIAIRNPYAVKRRRVVNNKGDNVYGRHTVRSTTSQKLVLAAPPIPQALLSKPAILLFGSFDVRFSDNKAFEFASFHSEVVPVFLWCRAEQGKWGVTGAVEVVLKDALRNLDSTLRSHGSKLICRNTNHSTEQELLDVCQEVGATTVYWNREHTTESRIRETKRKRRLEKESILVVECQSSLLYDPEKLSLPKGYHGGHWGTLMPFLKACKNQLGQPRRPSPTHVTSAALESLRDKQCSSKKSISTVEIDDLDMAIVSGSHQWDVPILQRFPMSEEAAKRNLESFFAKGFPRYEQDRSRADIQESTSMLSAHLRIGTLSPNVLYYKTIDDKTVTADRKKTFSRRLFWRDLAYFQLLTFPTMREKSIREHYEQTEWVSAEEEDRRFKAWKWGKTGFPIVDAGMRELYATGWMTQSVRMVVASFLVEYLRVNWVKGCEWFHYTLVDADSAINAMMWQNAGRSGIDQWNFVLSPETASQDGSGAYVKKWVPELSQLPKPFWSKPWLAPRDVLGRCGGIVLGQTYPNRVVTNLEAERSLSVDSVRRMRHMSQENNDDRGYDLIELPSGDRTVVFTKREYRIDRMGKPRISTSGSSGKRLSPNNERTQRSFAGGSGSASSRSMKQQKLNFGKKNVEFS